MTAEVSTAIGLFPALKNKCAVKLISQLNNAKEQSRVQKETQGFVNEVIGFFTGESRRRQDCINNQLVDVVDEVVDQLVDVMDAVVLNAQTLNFVIDELKNIQLHTEAIAYEVIEVKDRLTQLESKVHQHFCSLTDAVEELDCRHKAHLELDRAFLRWESGALNELPISLRAYSVFEQLWWGDFGFYIKKYPGLEADKFIQFLRERAIACFSKDLQTKAKDRMPRVNWLSLPSESALNQLNLTQSINLLSDWATEESAPFVTVLCGHVMENQDSLTVPHLFSAERFGTELVQEIFVDRERA